MQSKPRNPLLAVAVVASLLVLARSPASAQGVDGAPSPTPHAVVASPQARCAFSLLCAGWERIRLSNAPSDSRTGGTPETSARTPGGPPDDANAGLTFELPSAHVFH